MMEILAVHLKEQVDRAVYEQLLQQAAPERQQKALAYIRYEDSVRCLVGDRLAREAISRKSGQSAYDIQFGVDEYGKPHVISSSELFFNISHSEEWIVCATDSMPIGIDVECIRPIDLQIASHFFSKQECAQLMSIPTEQRAPFFYELWTLKESYMKADGRGLSIPLHSFTIRKTDASIELETNHKLRSCYFKQYDIDAFYKLAVCSMHDEFPNQIITVELSSFVK